MTETTFFRLLGHEVKGEALGRAIEAIANGDPTPTDTYVADPQSFRQIPGSPFAYWVRDGLRQVFTQFRALEADGRQAQSGASTMNDFKFLRAWWETAATAAARDRASTFREGRWVPIAKGGAFSRYYTDWELVLDWKRDGEILKKEVAEYRGSRGWGYHWTAAINGHSYYFRPGLTWPRRTQGGFSVRALPTGCIIGDKGPSVFVPLDDQAQLLLLLALMNSEPFRKLIDLQMTFGSYEVGVIERTPVPPLAGPLIRRLVTIAAQCIDLKRSLDSGADTTHAFAIAALIQTSGSTLARRAVAWQARLAETEQRLAASQAEIDEISYELYGISEEDHQAIEASIPSTKQFEPVGDDGAVAEDEDAEEEASGVDTTALVTGLLSYAVGCAFGRWDVRVGLDPSLAPKLADPFAPLPVCSPGTLVGPDGLPARCNGIASEEWMRARPDVITLPKDGALANPTIPDDRYPLPIPWEGTLVDDPNHPEDLVRRVRSVLDLLFASRSEAIEREACQILGVKELRDYFRNPRGFFDYHIKTYSKSRRKAPIYWLLQSARRSHGLWLYYHRLDSDILFHALVNYVDPKLRMEESRLAQLRTERAKAGTTGGPARKLERAIERQEDLLSEIHDFREKLERAANLRLAPDLDDGVVLNIAPLRELVPWKVAADHWKELTSGRYEWSSISRQLCAKGVI